VIPTNRTDVAWPTSLLELTNAAWRGKVAMAFPQFGTTATHFHVLRQHWGDELWQQWCRGLVANEIRVLDGNSTVVKMVARGEAWIGMTDTDDVAAGQREGLGIQRGPELAGMRLFIPNTVAIVRGAPHPNSAEKLAAYLQTPTVREQLLDAGAITYAELPLTDGPVLQPDWNSLLADLETTTETLSEIFLK
jgi:iron(III) transport system substrate-binding protein